MLNINNIRKKGRLIVVAFVHNTGGHLITIDLVDNLILDSDSRNQQPFKFNDYYDITNILNHRFYVMNVDECKIENVDVRIDL